MIVFDGMLRITVCGDVHETDFAELGVDQKSQPIELLKLFAAARGTMGTAKIQELVSGDAAVKMRVLRLRQFLQELIGVDGDPIENHRKAKAYVCQFEIRLAGDEGFRTPAGVTWLDLGFHERVDGRILVTVPERQQFRARGAQNRSGEAVGEVAEDRGTVPGHTLWKRWACELRRASLLQKALPLPNCSVPAACSRAAATIWWCSTRRATPGVDRTRR